MPVIAPAMRIGAASPAAGAAIQGPAWIPAPPDARAARPSGEILYEGLGGWIVATPPGPAVESEARGRQRLALAADETACELGVSREDLDAHIRSAEYRLLLAVIDLSVTPPDISFDDLEHIGGLDTVHAVRAPQQTIPEEA